ncbi:hypothetical protein V8C35DRAFT_311822 [Trichoderma chlorosporum]
MKDGKLGHDTPGDTSSGSSTGNEVQKESTDAKGKQKAGLGLAASQLGASAKLVVNAITTSRELPALTSELKSSSGSSRLGSISSTAGESSSYKSPQNTLLDRRQKFTNESQDDLFDVFTKSSTDVLANGYQVGVFGSSFASQEASDGLAVLELLSRQENEFLETTLYREHDSYMLGEDKLCNEAAAGAISDQEDHLDFTPEFITKPELSQQAAPYLGTTNIEETSSTWLGYWGEVFTAYNARVWGNSNLESASGASSQILEQEVDGNEPTTINRALDRLKLIFYHLRG